MKQTNKHQKISTLILLIASLILFNISFISAASFNSGDKVQVINTLSTGLKVRSAPAGTTIVTIKYDGSIGTIMSDPSQYAYLGGIQYHWWKIDWGSGVVGWSADGYPGGVDYLTKVCSSLCTSEQLRCNGNYKQSWAYCLATSVSSPAGRCLIL